AFLHQAHHPIQQQQPYPQLGKAGQQLSDGRLDMQATEQDRGGHRQQSARRGAAPLQNIVGLFNFGNTGPAVVEKQRPFLGQADNPIQQQQPYPQLGKAGQQLSDGRLDMQATEQDRGGHRQQSARRGAAPLQNIVGLFNFGNTGPAVVEKQRPFLGQADTAGGSSQQLDTQTGFKRSNGA